MLISVGKNSSKDLILLARNYEDGGEIPENFQKEFKVINLINGYRDRGHLFTKTNPVRDRRTYSPTLAIENFGLEESDLDMVFQAGEEIGIGPATLRAIIDDLEETYCQSIGIEYTYMREPDHIAWFRDHIELRNRPKYDAEKKKEIYKETCCYSWVRIVPWKEIRWTKTILG